MSVFGAIARIEVRFRWIIVVVWIVAVSRRHQDLAVSRQRHQDEQRPVPPRRRPERKGRLAGRPLRRVDDCVNSKGVATATWWTLSGTKCQAGTGISVAQVPEPRPKVSSRCRIHAALSSMNRKFTSLNAVSDGQGTDDVADSDADVLPCTASDQGRTEWR
jgi:hypothetical protein